MGEARIQSTESSLSHLCLARSVRLRTNGLNGDGPSLEMRSFLLPLHLRLRWRLKRQSNFRRSQVAEFPHAWIKERCGLRQFRCRGQEKTSMEVTWACLSYNIIRWLSIRRKLNASAAA